MVLIYHEPETGSNSSWKVSWSEISSWFAVTSTPCFTDTNLDKEFIIRRHFPSFIQWSGIVSKQRRRLFINNTLIPNKHFSNCKFACLHAVYVFLLFEKLAKIKIVSVVLIYTTTQVKFSTSQKVLVLWLNTMNSNIKQSQHFSAFCVLGSILLKQKHEFCRNCLVYAT